MTATRRYAPRLGGIGDTVRQRVEEMTGKEARCVVLGHLQRGGSPNAFDRMFGTNFGACAVRALANGQTGKMVALQAGTVVNVPLSDAIANIKTVLGGRTTRSNGARHRHFIRRAAGREIIKVSGFRLVYSN